jgi:CSLREA domain-containing protein
MVLPTGRGRAAVASIAVAAVAILGLEAALADSAAIFTVGSSQDAVDARPGDGSCATLAGACTLRAAIQEANARPGADVIDVPAGTYALAIPPLNQNDIATGDLDITDSVTISGAGAGITIVDGGVPVPGSPPDVHGLDRLFEVVDGATVDFSGLTFSDGYAAEYGGAIANNSSATITVTTSVLTRNVAEKAGGAIDNHLGGAVVVRNSRLSDNFAYENGSALNNNRDGTLTVTDSIVSSNSAVDVGVDELLLGAGAISNNAELDAIGRIVVRDSVLSDNRAGGGRAGATISNDGAGSVSVERTLFSKNVATGDGGAIFNDSGVVEVTATVMLPCRAAL